MTTIDPKEYLTLIQAAAKVGCPRRSLYRIIDRLGVNNIVTMAFGKRLIHKSKLPAIRAEHAPLGSKRRHEIAVASGSKGGAQKGVNYARAALSGTSDAPAADSQATRSRRAPSR
jgi:hypothetical protein